MEGTTRDLEGDLIPLLRVARRPVRIDEASAVLAVDQSALVDAVEALVSAGAVVESSDGITLGGSAPEAASATRHAHMAGRWAEHLAATGGAPAQIGLAYATAGRHAEALTHLLTVATDDADEDVLDTALASGERSRTLAPADEGRLRLARAVRRRGRGDSRGADEDLSIALRRLTGTQLISALGFAAAVADDLQQPQRAETLTALAAHEAATAGEPAMLGSLLTLQGRSLSRIGYPVEADRALEVGTSLVGLHGTETQRYNARTNQAWVWLDRGDVRRAESAFEQLRDEALDMDRVALAGQTAYLARAGFGTGRVRQAITAAEEAERIATETGAAAPAFLAGLARIEGAWLFGRFSDGLEVSDRVLAIVLEHLPAWENMVRAWRAQLFAGVGRIEEAGTELERGLETCPPGIDGWRWRSRIRGIAMGLLSDAADWPTREAEDLTDELLQARWFDAACALMAVRAMRERDKELGEQAAALGLQLGNPMLAARAVDAAGSWTDPIAISVARAVKGVLGFLPESWRDDLESFPPAAHALAVETEGEVDTTDVEAKIDEALRAAGLSGTEVILSPAQRRARGLVRRRPSRVRRPLGIAAAAIAVVVLSGVTAFAVTTMGEDDVAAPTTTAPTTTTTEPRMEDTGVEVPEGGLSGQSFYRGGPARDGVTAGGVVEPIGKYWEASPGGFFATDPVAYGRLLFLGSGTGDEVIALSQEDGSVLFEVPTRDRVRSAPAVAQVGETTSMVFGADDGRLYARNAIQANATMLWDVPVPGAVAGSPVFVDGIVVVATDEGVLRAADIQDGDTVWEYAGTEDRPLGAVDTSPAYADGIVYVVDQGGIMHLVDLASGSPICDFEAFGPVAANPIVSDGAVYLPTTIGHLHILPSGRCSGAASGTVGQIGGLAPFEQPPAIRDGIIYALEAQRLLALDSTTGQLLSLPWPYDAKDRITTAPVVAGELVYIGTQGGTVIAVDATTGEERWRFETGSPIAAAPAVVDSALFVTTADGRVIAIAGDAP